MRERQIGYQEALAHLQAALDQRGSAGARQWIADNRHREFDAEFDKIQRDFESTPRLELTDEGLAEIYWTGFRKAISDAIPDLPHTSMEMVVHREPDPDPDALRAVYERGRADG